VTRDRVSIDIGICPTELEAGDGGDIRDGDRVVESVKAYARNLYPNATLIEVQIGWRQGSKWAFVGDSAEAGRILMDDYWDAHADDETLFAGGDK
jgi:hypothetical protein